MIVINDDDDDRYQTINTSICFQHLPDASGLRTYSLFTLQFPLIRTFPSDASVLHTECRLCSTAGNYLVLNLANQYSQVGFFLYDGPFF